MLAKKFGKACKIGLRMCFPFMQFSFTTLYSAWTEQISFIQRDSPFFTPLQAVWFLCTQGKNHHHEKERKRFLRIRYVPWHTWLLPDLVWMYYVFLTFIEYSLKGKPKKEEGPHPCPWPKPGRNPSRVNTAKNAIAVTNIAVMICKRRASHCATSPSEKNPQRVKSVIIPSLSESSIKELHFKF